MQKLLLIKYTKFIDCKKYTKFIAYKKYTKFIA